MEAQINDTFILLIPDEEELEFTFKSEINPKGYSKILVHENLVVRLRESRWYRKLILNYQIPKIWIVRKKNLENFNSRKDLLIEFIKNEEK